MFICDLEKPLFSCVDGGVNVAENLFVAKVFQLVCRAVGLTGHL